MCNVLRILWTTEREVLSAKPSVVLVQMPYSHIGTLEIFIHHMCVCVNLCVCVGACVHELVCVCVCVCVCGVWCVHELMCVCVCILLVLQVENDRA